MNGTILNPIEAVLAACKKFSGVHEDPTNSNRSVEIDYWLSQLGTPLGLPWCAAYVTYCGVTAMGNAWPVLRSPSVQSIVDWWLAKGKTLSDTPQPGDIMVIYYTNLKRYGHIGMVNTVGTGTFTSWEGNTNTDGSRDGYKVALQTRKVGARFKFIRWIDLVQ